MALRTELCARIDNGLYDAQSDLWWQPDSALHQLKVSFNPIFERCMKYAMSVNWGFD